MVAVPPSCNSNGSLRGRSSQSRPSELPRSATILSVSWNLHFRAPHSRVFQWFCLPLFFLFLLMLLLLLPPCSLPSFLHPLSSLPTYLPFLLSLLVELGGDLHGNVRADSAVQTDISIGHTMILQSPSDVRSSCHLYDAAAQQCSCELAGRFAVQHAGQTDGDHLSLGGVLLEPGGAAAGAEGDVDEDSILFHYSATSQS